METITTLDILNCTAMFSRKHNIDYGICCSMQPWKVNLTGIQVREAAQIFRYPGQGCGQVPPASLPDTNLPDTKLLGFLFFR